MLSLRTIVLALAGLLAVAFPAAAMDLRVVPPTGDTLSNSMYIVSYRCDTTNKAKLPSGFGTLFGSETFGFSVIKDVTSTGLPSVSEASSGAAYIAVVFSTTNNRIEDLDCEGQFVLFGSEIPPTLMAFGLTDFASQVAFLDAATTLASEAVSPLFSLLAGTPFTRILTQEAATSATTLASKISTFFQQIKGHDEREPMPLNREGHFTISTKFVNVEGDIARVPSLLMSTFPFRRYATKILSDSALTLPEEETRTGLAQACNQQAQVYSQLGVPALIDKAYLLVVQGAAKVSGKEGLLNCLGRARAVAALERLDLFTLDTNLQFTLDDVNLYEPAEWESETHGTQPGLHPDLPDLADTLSTDLARLGESGELPVTEANLFWPLFAEQIKVHDHTFSFMAKASTNRGDNVWAGDAKTLVLELIAGGWKLWSCPVLTRKYSKLKSTENEALYILTKFGSNDPRLVVARVFFNQDAKVSAFVFEDISQTNWDLSVAASLEGNFRCI